MSVRDSSFLAWVKLYYQSPDGGNRFPSYYLKGGVISLLLDMYIISHSDAKSSLDDGMRALWKRYQDDPETGVTEDECIALIERATGVQLRERLMGWLDGTAELPYDEIFEPMGLRLEVGPDVKESETFGAEVPFANVPSKVSCGWTLKDSDGKVTVRAVRDGGAAQKAGIGIDDEIVAINGMRVNSTGHLDDLLAAAGGSVKVTAQCDGRLYTAELSPEAVIKATLTKIEDMTERQSQNFAKWLSRPQ